MRTTLALDDLISEAKFATHPEQLIPFVFECTWKTFREHFFVVFAGADYNRLQNYKITKFTVFVSGGGEGNGDEGGGGWGEQPKLNKCEQGGRGSKSEHFVIV